MHMEEQMSFFPQPARSLSVFELNSHLRGLIESDPTLQDVWVQGEVSNLSRPKSGHLYFTIKDSSAALRCVMWRTQAQRLRGLPRDGESVASGVVGRRWRSRCVRRRCPNNGRGVELGGRGD